MPEKMEKKTQRSNVAPNTGCPFSVEDATIDVHSGMEANVTSDLTPEGDVAWPKQVLSGSEVYVANEPNTASPSLSGKGRNPFAGYRQVSSAVVHKGNNRSLELLSDLWDYLVKYSSMKGVMKDATLGHIVKELKQFDELIAGDPILLELLRSNLPTVWREIAISSLGESPDESRRVAVALLSSMSKEEVGRRIHQLRNKHGLSQKQLESLSGVHQSDISEYENGRHMPGLEQIDRLVLAMDETRSAILKK